MKDYYKVGPIDIYIKDQLPSEVDASFVFNYISARVPFYLLGGIEVIYVGVFPEMTRREINAYYEDDAIYVTSEQEDEMDMIEDIIHEISHAVEKRKAELIYGDSSLEREFIAKRENLENRIKDSYDVPSDFSITIEYDRDIDMFLYREIGYDVLEQICSDIFISPYSVTSVSEFWAKGFEEFFIGDRKSVKSLCPVLYSKILQVIEEEKENT